MRGAWATATGLPAQTVDVRRFPGAARALSALRAALPAGIDAASQAEVDRALAELRTGPDRSTAPKGAAPATNDEIARAVRDSDDTGITADEVAKQVGVSRVTAWRYLERLADEGTVCRHTDYGKAGRPKTRYQWR